MKILAIIIGLAFCYSAFALPRPGFEKIAQSEMPSLQNILSAAIQGSLSLARKDPNLALGTSIFHVDRISTFERNIRKDGVTYLIEAGVSDTANPAFMAVVECEVEQDAKTGKFTLKKSKVSRV